MKNMLFPVLDDGNEFVREVLFSTRNLGSMCVAAKSAHDGYTDDAKPIRKVVLDDDGAPIMLFTVRMHYGSDTVGQTYHVSRETYLEIVAHFGDEAPVEDDLNYTSGPARG